MVQDGVEHYLDPSLVEPRHQPDKILVRPETPVDEPIVDRVVSVTR
jgi:hypothetical protein